MGQSKILNLVATGTLMIGASIGLSACTQSTPTMMNVSPVELAYETSIEQIPLKNLGENNLTFLAEQHRQYGSGLLDLTITYDPKSKSFTAMNAVHELNHIQTFLKKKGVRSMAAQTLAVPDGSPSLMVSFDSVRAQAPSDCGAMPGLDNNETTRKIGDYKFGCGTESMLARQIARPSDLAGKSEMDIRGARRDAIMIDGYSSGVPRKKLEGVERADLVSGG